MIWPLLLLASLASAEFTPLPASTPEATNSNFKAIDEEVRRLEAAVTSTSTASGKLADTNAWTGGNSWSGGSLFTGPSTFTGTAYMPWGRTIWMNMVGTGTVAIMTQLPAGSFSAPGDDGSEGSYIINFANAWTNNDSYACSCMTMGSDNNNRGVCSIRYDVMPTTTQLYIFNHDSVSGNLYDATRVFIICIGY